MSQRVLPQQLPKEGMPQTMGVSSLAGSGSEEEAGPSQVVPDGDSEVEEWETPPEGDSYSYQSAEDDLVPDHGSSLDAPPVTLTAEEIEAFIASVARDSSSSEEENIFRYVPRE